MALDLDINHPPEAIRRARAEVPQLHEPVNGKKLIYLDSAATSLKPQPVIDRLVRFYSHEYGTVRRGAYFLSQESTAMYEGVRDRVAAFFGAASSDEIVFVRGVTEGINLIAMSFSRGIFEPGDEVLITGMEHHANIVPWQLIAKQTGIVLRHAPIDDNGQIELDRLAEMVNERTRLVSVVHVANSLGTVNPVAEVAKIAHDAGAYLLVDGAQSAPHLPINVQELGCDFFICSGHKMLGPTGVGVFYGRRELLDRMPPYQGGGEMIDKVTFEETTFEDPPHKFEAGTPPFAQVIGLGAAIDYLSGIGMETVHAWDQTMLRYTTEQLKTIDGLRIHGNAANKSGLVAFEIDGAHPFDIATILDQEGVCIRSGHHCAQPVMRRYEVSATARASFYIYNDKSDIDALVAGLNTACDLLK